jgi:HNH endonuclease
VGTRGGRVGDAAGLTDDRVLERHEQSQGEASVPDVPASVAAIELLIEVPHEVHRSGRLGAGSSPGIDYGSGSPLGLREMSTFHDLFSEAPMRASSVCAVAGCRVPAVSVDGRCEAHRRRGGAKWRALRDQVRDRAGGSCERCGRRTGLAVHHINPLVGGAPELVPIDELEALCDLCHAQARYGEVG